MFNSEGKLAAAFLAMNEFMNSYQYYQCYQYLLTVPAIVHYNIIISILVNLVQCIGLSHVHAS